MGNSIYKTPFNEDQLKGGSSIWLAAQKELEAARKNVSVILKGVFKE